MASDQEDKVNCLFEAARKLDGKYREAFLSTLDPSLRQEVESLLANEEGATVEKSTAFKPLSPDTKPAERIGPYRIFR